MEDEGLGLVLTPVSCGGMVVSGLQDPETEVSGIQDIDVTVQEQETVVGGRPTGILLLGGRAECGLEFRVCRRGGEGVQDVLPELLLVMNK